MKPLLAPLIVVILLAAGASFWLLKEHRPASAPGSATTPAPSPETALTVYCAASLKKSVETIAEQYRRESGVEVRLQYGPTGALLSNLRISKQGDLLLAADDGNIADGRKYDVIRDVIPLVKQHPVIAVRTGNPKGVHTIDDLLQPGLRVALPNADTASIGKVSRKTLGDTWTKLVAAAAVVKPSVTEVASDLSLGAVDAAIIWDAVVPQFKNIEAVEVPELSSRSENASAAVLSFCTQPAAALKFAHYLVAPDKGGLVFQRNGFKLASDAPSTEKPESHHD